VVGSAAEDSVVHVDELREYALVLTLAAAVLWRAAT